MFVGTTRLTFLAHLVIFLGCGEDSDDPPGAVTSDWQRGLPDATVMRPGSPRGLAAARGIVHLHSPYSHDACDNDPRGDDGAIREDCLADLRAALCTTTMDFAALSDHDATMADEEWGPGLFLVRGRDELVLGPDGSPVASRLLCEDGRQLLLFVGGENDLMPLMLDRHPDGPKAMRHAIYDGKDSGAVVAYRGLGGLAWIGHSESKELELLRALKLDGMEVYNLHAAIDPKIREDDLGLDPDEAIQRAAEFADESDPYGPEPDLMILGFLEENRPSLGRWESLLAEGYRMTVTAGTDAHQNALPIKLRDGERADSYRRMMRWFSNVVLVRNPDHPAHIELALAQGRMFVAFEILGTPAGFDVRAELAAGGVAEIGAELRVADAVRIVADTPAVHGLRPGVPEPAIVTRIVRVDSGGPHEVASGIGEVSVLADQPGAYRVEVRMKPLHLAAYLGSVRPRGYAEREYVWIYANPIYVRP